MKCLRSDMSIYNVYSFQNDYDDDDDDTENDDDVNKRLKFLNFYIFRGYYQNCFMKRIGSYQFCLPYIFGV